MSSLSLLLSLVVVVVVVVVGAESDFGDSGVAAVLSRCGGYWLTITMVMIMVTTTTTIALLLTEVVRFHSRLWTVRHGCTLNV